MKGWSLKAGEREREGEEEEKMNKAARWMRWAEFRIANITSPLRSSGLSYSQLFIALVGLKIVLFNFSERKANTELPVAYVSEKWIGWALAWLVRLMEG